MPNLFSRRLKSWVRDNAGKEDETNVPDMAMIEKNFVRMMKKEDWILDDQAFNDLDMGKVYLKMNRTMSNPGQQMLYNMFRILKFDEDELKKRDRLIEFFQMNKEPREKIQCVLHYMGNEEFDSAAECLYGTPNKLPPGRGWIMPLTLGMIASLVSIPFLGVRAILLIVIFLVLNMIIHAQFSRYTEKGLPGIRAVARMLTAAREIVKLDIPELKDGYNDFFDKAVDKCSAILKKNKALAMQSGSDTLGILLYLRIMFLTDERAYLRCVRDIKELAPVLRTLYRRLGELDAFQSMSYVRRAMVPVTRPVFTDKPNYLKVEQIGHPTLTGAVLNDLTLDGKNMVLTGSNMSGKSTFLRTLGLNMVLAQTFYMVRARHYEADMMALATSISPSDDLSEGTSYYMAEAKALQRMLAVSDSEHPSLLLVDEIFRGTNPTERVAAASALLTYLSKRPCLVIVATHDIEITRNVKDFYDSYHFEESVSKDALTFDYKLKPGVLKKPNGIRILAYLGYPDEIVDMALDNVRKEFPDQSDEQEGAFAARDEEDCENKDQGRGGSAQAGGQP